MPVSRSLSFRRVAIAASLLVLVPVFAGAQTTPAKPPPRLPPPPSQTSQIPNGVDAGTPATSDALQLGTPVMSNATNGPTGRGMSAAARAAARPKGPASGVDCTKPVASTTEENKATPATLPKAGLTGKATPPAPPAKPPVARGATRIDC
jgi:hypothetical protein